MTEHIGKITKFCAGAIAAFFLGMHWMIHLLLVGILFDIATGLVVAFQTRQVDSTVSRVGISRKVQTVLFVLAAEIAGRYTHLEVTTPWGEVWGLGAAVAGYYCVHEALSITENLGKSGVPLPRFVTEGLRKLNPD